MIGLRKLVQISSDLDRLAFQLSGGLAMKGQNGVGAELCGARIMWEQNFVGLHLKCSTYRQNIHGQYVTILINSSLNQLGLSLRLALSSIHLLLYNCFYTVSQKSCTVLTF